MASNMSADTPEPVVASSPVAAPVEAKTSPVPKADPVPTKAEKIEAKAAEIVKPATVKPAAVKLAAELDKAVAKVAAPVLNAVANIPAPVKMPVAKKKAIVKAAPKFAAKPVKTFVAAAVAPTVVAAKTIPTKEETIMETTIKNATEKAKTMFADVNAKSNAAFGDINDFTKGNVEALVESGKIAAKGMEAMGQDAAEYSRKQFEGMTATMKSLSTIKSPTDFFKLQSDYMRASFDSMVAQTSKNTEAMLKLAGEVAQPIQNRVSVAVEKVKIAA